MQTHRLHTPDTAAFYRTPIGQKVQTLVQRHITSLHIPPNNSAVAIGDGTPYTACLPEHTILARLNHPLTRATAPQNLHLKECVTDTQHLPFDDCSVPLILAIHAVEFAPAPSTFLRAMWKMMTDDGHLILIVPNRSGLWAHSDSTHFGQGTPFSTQQIQRLLMHNLFKIDHKRSTLITPPLLLKHSSGRFMEHIAPYLPSAFAGLHLLVVRKNLYAGIPLGVRHKTRPSPRQITAAAWNHQDPSAS